MTTTRHFGPIDILEERARALKFDARAALNKITSGETDGETAAGVEETARVVIELAVLLQHAIPRLAGLALAQNAAGEPAEPPIGAVVLDRDGAVWQRRADGQWHGVGGGAAVDWDYLLCYQPIRVLRTPGEAT